jgi:hypothetical protein
MSHTGSNKSKIGGKVTLGGLKRWFSPRGQDLAFLMSCIGLVRPSSSVDLKQNKTKQIQQINSRDPIVTGRVISWPSVIAVESSDLTQRSEHKLKCSKNRGITKTERRQHAAFLHFRLRNCH